MERFIQVCITWPLFQMTSLVPLYCSRYDVGKCMLETILSHPVCTGILAAALLIMYIVLYLHCLVIKLV